MFIQHNVCSLTTGTQALQSEREAAPPDSVAALQEQLAASKLREAESGLALRDLRAKVTTVQSGLL